MILEKLKTLETIISRDYNNIACIVIQKRGKTLYENYFNGYTADNALHIYSVTKSVFSALVGIAIDKGYIKSIDQKVLDFFPDYTVAKGEKNISHITIRNMLTMTAPYKYEAEPYEAFFMSDNWMKFALDLLDDTGRIGDFIYSGIVGTHILSGILAKATGQPILDFATEHLFLPMDIDVPCNVSLRTKEEHIAAMSDKNNSGWAVDPQGINPAGWGLFLRPLDMAKIGQLYLDNGMWYGQQIVPSRWVAQSTKRHSHWGELSYGYLWWIIDDEKHIYAAMGDGGNVIYVNPQHELVIAIASIFVSDVKDRIGFIMACIEPLFKD